MEKCPFLRTFSSFWVQQMHLKTVAVTVKPLQQKETEEKRMSSTALRAAKAVIFISEAHEKFYYEKLKEVRYQDVQGKNVQK